MQVSNSTAITTQPHATLVVPETKSKISTIKKRVPPIRYHKQLFQSESANYKKVDSSLYVHKNNDFVLKMNLHSSIFDGGFNLKKISKLDLVNNYDGSVDIAIQFEKDIFDEGVTSTPITIIKK